MEITVENWIAYAAARGSVVTDDEASAQALQRGLDHIEFSYVNRFASGYSLDSPNVDKAVYEAAALELATPNFFTKAFTPDQQRVLTEVKGIKWTVRGGAEASGAQGATPVSTKIEAMLRPYLTFPVGIRAL